MPPPRRPGLHDVRAGLSAAAGQERFLGKTADRTNLIMVAHRLAQQLPKTELHLHLDGSITPEFICMAAERRGIVLPPVELLPRHIDELRDASYSKRPATGKTAEAGRNWGIFDWMNQFLQSAWELEEGAATLMASLADDNVRYAEIRFCPELHTTEGLSLAEVVVAVCRGVRHGCEGSAIQGGVIVCALRSFSAEHSLRHAQLAHEFLGQGVLGFDLAGDENYMLSLHTQAFEYCARHGVPFTIHAGELMPEEEPAAMVPNLTLALELGARRLGHGFALCQDKSGELVRRAAAAGVTVEVCLPICLNPRFAWYCADPAHQRPSATGTTTGGSVYAAHPITDWHAAGLAAALSCDNITLSGTRAISSSSMLVHLVVDLGFSWAEARQVLLNGVRAAFLPETAGAKAALIEDFTRELDATFRAHGLLHEEDGGGGGLSLASRLQGGDAAPSSRPVGFSVRNAVAAEYPQVVSIVNTAFAAAYAHVRPQPPETSPPRITLEKLQHSLQQSSACEVLVCVASGDGGSGGGGGGEEIVGTVTTNQWYAALDFASAGREDTDSFGSLAVAPHAQHHGVGQLLVAAVEDRARQRGKARLEICFVHGLEFGAHMPDLYSFYRRLGYKEGEKEGRESWYDVLPEFRRGLYFQQMVKALLPAG